MEISLQTIPRFASAGKIAVGQTRLCRASISLRENTIKSALSPCALLRPGIKNLSAVICANLITPVGVFLSALTLTL